jgi:hypothetical protein
MNDLKMLNVTSDNVIILYQQDDKWGESTTSIWIEQIESTGGATSLQK